MVASDIAAQVAAGSSRVFGVMVESHLQEGAQRFRPGQDRASDLEYGQSITDACLGWDDSVQVLETLSQAVRHRRRHRLAGVPVNVRMVQGCEVYSVASTSPDAAFVDLVDAPVAQTAAPAVELDLHASTGHSHATFAPLA